MRFYTQTHRHYCGIDLHARTMYLCILDAQGNKVHHRNHRANPDELLSAVYPYREDIVLAAECMFSWYWLADICEDVGIPFVLGHALYMRAIHGGKAKNDRIDAHKIAVLLRGGMLPMAYIYPRSLRSTRDLLRRRMHLVHLRSDMLSHIHGTNAQINLDEFGAPITASKNRQDILERFDDASTRKTIEADLALVDHYEVLIRDLEQHILRLAKEHNGHAMALLRTIPGVGDILSMTMMYEIGDIRRFERVQEMASYCRLIKPTKESAGKVLGHSGAKIGNPHLKWAFSEAALLFPRHSARGRKLYDRLKKKHGRGKCLTVLAHKLARAVYHMLKRKEVFDIERFVTA